MSTHDDAPEGVTGSTGSPQPDSPQRAESIDSRQSAPIAPPHATDPVPSADPSGHGTGGPLPAVSAEPAPRARLRVGTVVWGLVITAIGIMVLATASGASFDLGLVMIGLIGFAGIALLIGSIASGIRHRHP